ncbi:MAG: response regulator [Candidatus Cloacimonetes bacterium]|nr:response regulator [Candidatus Cloacimonadota bacterium]
MEKIKILLVEDEAIIARYLSMELELEGFEICGFVANGNDAIQKALEEKPDLILMDINLQGDRDGIETMEIIREEQLIPVIFMSGYSRTEYTERANKLDPISYFVKPIEAEFISPIIKEYFKEKLK